MPELSHLAPLYRKEGDITQALAILERAWRIVDSPLGDANSRLRVLLALAVTLTTQHDNKKTESYFLRAVALLDAVPPALRQADGQAAYHAYEAFLKQNGRNREARMIEKRAVTLFGPRASSSVIGVEALFQK